MAVLTKQSFTNQTNVATKADLNAGPHTLLWEPNTSLVFESAEIGSLTINVVGDNVTTVPCNGYGNVTVSAGFDIVVGAGETVVVPLNTINAFLGAVKNNVTLTVTGSTGASLSFVYWRV